MEVFIYGEHERRMKELVKGEIGGLAACIIRGTIKKNGNPSLMRANEAVEATLKVARTLDIEKKELLERVDMIKYETHEILKSGVLDEPYKVFDKIIREPSNKFWLKIASSEALIQEIHDM